MKQDYTITISDDVLTVSLIGKDRHVDIGLTSETRGYDEQTRFNRLIAPALAVVRR